jgi:hypothetical protein
VFGGYIAGNSQHSERIDQIKTSCRVTVTSPFGDVQDVSDSIEWTALTPSDMRQGRATRCELKGYAPYVPRNIGRAAVEMRIEFAREQAAPSTERASGQSGDQGASTGAERPEAHIIRSELSVRFTNLGGRFRRLVGGDDTALHAPADRRAPGQLDHGDAGHLAARAATTDAGGAMDKPRSPWRATLPAAR